MRGAGLTSRQQGLVSGRGSEFLYPAGWVAVPCLTARALPEVVLGFKAAGRAAVATEGFHRVVQCTLHLRVQVFVFKFFPGNPACGGDQGGFTLQMPYVSLAALLGGATVRGLQADQGFEHIKGRRLVVQTLEQGAGFIEALTCPACRSSATSGTAAGVARVSSVRVS
jgi:hypothetical protein